MKARFGGALAGLLLAGGSTAAADTQSRVVGGQPAASPHPYAAYLEIRFENAVGRCGGTLIAARFVLTAAHCLRDEGGQPPVQGGIDAVIGVSDVGGSIPAAKVYKGLGYEIHPQAGARPADGPDVAILTLPRPAPEEPLRLPRPQDGARIPTGTLATAIGWGRTEEGRASNVLREVTLPILEDDRCSNYGSAFRGTFMLCAGGESGRDTCQGDSGGPLLVPDGTRPMLGGITSFGNGCGVAPGVYTRATADTINAFVRERVPQVEIDLSVPRPEPGQTVTLTATSRNPFGPYERFEWDLDGDGAFDDAAGGSVATVFSTGVHMVGVVASRGTGDQADREVRRIDVETRFRSPVAFVAESLRVGEGQPIEVGLIKPAAGAGTISLLAGGTARAGLSLARVTSLAFADGDTERTLTIPTVQDRVDQPDRALTLELTSATGELIAAAPARVRVTVVDDDRPPVARAAGSRVRRISRRGRVSVPVAVEAAGTVRLALTDPRGRTLATSARRTFADAGRARLSVGLHPHAVRTLRRGGTLAARAVVTYRARRTTLTGGQRSVRRLRLTYFR